MTIPANLTARHEAERRLLAAILAERRAFQASAKAPRDGETMASFMNAADERAEAEVEYIRQVDADVARVPDPIVENIAEAGTYEVHDCPGGAYVIAEPGPEGSFEAVEAVDLLGALQASMTRHRADTRAKQYDSGYRRREPIPPHVPPIDDEHYSSVAERAERGAYLAQER